MKPIRVIVFPFDQHGSPGTGAGAQLLGDALREMLADAEGESAPRRSLGYRDRLRIAECAFDRISRLKSWRERGAKLCAEHADDFILWLSGNHLGVLPVYESLPADSLVVQFDAHLDIFNLDDSETELSHGNFVMRARPKPPIINVGHRDLFLPHEHIGKYYADTFPASSWALEGAASLKKLDRAVRAAETVWIDIDCDVIDPAYLPASAQPEPFGLSPQMLVGILEAIWSEKVVGFSLSEFQPQRDQNDRSLATLCWLMEWVLLKAASPTRQQGITPEPDASARDNPGARRVSKG